MLFVPEIETFIYYLESRSKFHKSHSEKLRQNIIESTLNKFVFNIDYINCLEQNIDENHPLRDDCTPSDNGILFFNYIPLPFIS